MSGELNFVDLILNASVVVQIVLVLLLLASIASWAVIIDKRKLLKQAVDDADNFEASFWSGIDLTKFYKEIADPAIASSVGCGRNRA